MQARCLNVSVDGHAIAEWHMTQQIMPTVWGKNSLGSWQCAGQWLFVFYHYSSV